MAIRNAGKNADIKVISLKRLTAKLKVKYLKAPLRIAETIYRQA